MKTKLLCITLLTFAVLIFGANHYAARNELPAASCSECFCNVKLLTVLDPKAKKEPSCSVVFKYGRYMNLKLPPKDPKLPQLTVQQLYRSHVPDTNQDRWDIDACSPVVFCDAKCQVKLECYARSGSDTSTKEVDAYGENRCPIVCQHSADVSDVRIGCSHWERPAPKAAPKPPSKKRGLQWQESSLLPGFFDETMQTASVVSRFLPANYIYEPADEPEAKGIITRSAIWWLLEGEGGVDEDALTVATGEAAARSFCTGDTLRLAGPGAISLPNCQVDAIGRWEGGYVRRLPDGKLDPVAISLDLRKESGSLTTPDGVFNIVIVTRGFDIRLDASGTVAGQQREFHLNGKLTKGDIVFDGYESGVRLTGFVRRVYIADSALPIGILNQPYSFALTAFAPGGQALTFRLATPAVIEPEKITWNKDARDLRGRNNERVTYSCPPASPSINPTVYGTDVYTDDSSICKAAVHSGVMNPQTGGVVTIQIKPDAGSYTASTRNGVSSKSYGAYKGSYVFVSGESQGGEPGRLPKGLSFDSKSGTFSGTPTELGSFEISVVADDGAGNVFEQPLTITVKKLVVTSRLLPDGFVGQPYAATLKAAGGQPPYRFSGSPPKGLQLDPNTGELSGKPSSPSSGSDRYGNRASVTSFEVTISDSQNNSESQNVSLTVRGATIMNSHFLPDAKVGVPYRTQFQAVGTLSPINWVFGRADASSIGLALNEKTGELSGTPTKAGDFFFEVRAEVGSSVPSRQFALTIKP